MEKIMIYKLVSLKEDNEKIPKFKPRERYFTFSQQDTDAPTRMVKEYKTFTLEGVPGETIRVCLAVNRRNGDSVKKELLCDLINDDNFNVSDIQNKIGRISMKPEHAMDKKWILEFNDKSEKAFNEFLREVAISGNFRKKDLIIKHITNGYIVCVPHEFDTSNVEKIYGYAFKKHEDGYLPLKMQQKPWKGNKLE